MRIIFTLMFSLAIGLSTRAQWEEKTLLNDPRFTITYKYSLWSGLSEYEEVKFYVQNHTNTELQLVVNATINWTCARTSNFTLGYNKVVYMKPNGRFDAFKDDYVHSKETPRKNNNCFIQVGEKKFTTIQSVSVQVTSVKDLTAEKARIAQEKADKAAALEREKAAKAAALEKEKAAKLAAAQEAERVAKAKAAANAANNSNNNSNGNNNNNSSPSSRNSNSGSGGTSSGGNSNPNIVNGIDRSKLPALAMSRDGKYYRKDNANNYHEIDYDTYMAAKRDASLAKQSNITQPAANQKTNDQALADFKTRQQAATDKYFNDIAETNRRIEAKSALGMQSYYAAQAVQNLKNDLNNSSSLSGNYNSIEELQAEFRQKYNSINQQVNSLVEARNQSLQASANYSFSDGDATSQAIGQGIVAIGSIINSAKAEKEKREAREQLQRDRAAHEARIKAKQKALMLQLRNGFLEQFPDGGVPLSSHKVSTNELFFFSYVFDMSRIEDSKPKISVSNVFSINRYGDGTWPFKTTLQNDIKKLDASGKVILVGYYASKDMAASMQSSFKDMAGQSGFAVNDITYKGKKSSSSSGSNDFWGNGKKNTPTEGGDEIIEIENIKPAKKTNDDFWETGGKKTTPPTPAKKPVKKDDDFWKN